ncbi:hypothetical protein B0H13DRAFT_1871107 [Mycena leptocephala]|nr:hypothetical protein B0H13DRAFT_1871107 [Mycena leptocephala]
MSGKRPRAAAVSEKAKTAAAIAIAESQEDAGKPSTAKKKPRGKQPKKKPAKPEPEPDSEPEPEVEEDDIEVVQEDEGLEDIDWKDTDGIDLTWKLITAIEEDPLIRASLFPPIGSGKLSGGKPKSEYQYQLAKILFADHPKYEEAFGKAVAAKEKKIWYLKIKNRIDATNLAHFVVDSAGIESADDIKPGTSLTTKWVLTGLGNNDSEIDISILLGSERDGDDSSSTAFDDATDLPDDSDLPQALAPTLDSVKGKRKRKSSPDAKSDTDVKPGNKRTKPAPGISQPTPKKAAAAKPVTAKDKFAAAVLLKLKQSKHRDRKEVELERLKLKAEAKREKEKARLELAQLKMKHKHEFRLAEMRMTHAGLSSTSTYASSSHGPLIFLFFPLLHPT